MVCIKMAVTVKVYTGYKPILEWLTENVGPLLHHNAIIYWHGRGWHLTAGHEVAPRGQMGKNYCVVEFEDEQKAIWFSLLWQ